MPCRHHKEGVEAPVYRRQGGNAVFFAHSANVLVTGIPCGTVLGRGGSPGFSAVAGLEPCGSHFLTRSRFETVGRLQLPGHRTAALLVGPKVQC
jgi:hypothetical protein